MHPLLITLVSANPLYSQSAELPEVQPKGTIDAIINGNDATRDDFAMTGGTLMTGTVFDSPMNALMCSSTLIAPDVVLLAAHCLDEYSISFGTGIDDMRIYWTRRADLTEWDGSTQNPILPEDSIEAVDWIGHPDFDINTLETGLAENFDVALIFLSEAILDVEPAALPTLSEGEEIQQGDFVTVVGWGQQIATDWGEQSPPDSYAIKQQGESYIAEINSYEFKVGEEVSDVRKCHGDSGGPSFWEANEGLRLVGVTSHAYDDTGCNQTGGVDSRVDHYLNWINSEMETACANGTRVWCEEAGILPYGYFQEEEEEDEPEKNGIFGCASAPYDLIWYIPLMIGLCTRRRM